jgi:predicted negative regulator of RcsB-dependent stress response
MTIFITVLVIVLAVAGYIAYKIGAPGINKIKEAASQALDKIEPSIVEVKEIVEKAEKVAPKNETIKKATKAVKAAEEVVKKPKAKKIK